MTLLHLIIICSKISMPYLRVDFSNLKKFLCINHKRYIFLAMIYYIPTYLVHLFLFIAFHSHQFYCPEWFCGLYIYFWTIQIIITINLKEPSHKWLRNIFSPTTHINLGNIIHILTIDLFLFALVFQKVKNFHFGERKQNRY